MAGSAFQTATFRFPGCRVRVDASDVEALDQLRQVYAVFIDDSGDPPRKPDIVIRAGPNDRTLVHHQSVEPRQYVLKRGQILPRLEREINLLIAAAQSGRLLLHAAVVGSDGRGVLLLGASGSGKTTLAGGLVERGCSYVTDELAIIDPATGEVIPFPKSLSIRQDSFGLFGRVGARPLGPVHDRVWYLPAEQLRHGSLATSPLAPTCVLLPRYAAGRDTRLEKLTPGETFMALHESCVNLPDHGEAGVDLLVAMAASGFRVTYGHMPDACEQLLGLLLSD